MKKLLLAMTAIASLAFISKAATLSEPTGTSFESLAVDATLDIAIADDGTTDGTKYWLYDGNSAAETGVDTGCVIKTVDYTDAETGYAGTKPAIAPETDVKALGIEADKRLTRTITGVNGGSVDIGSGIYFDTMVQFTATDTAPALADGDKLVVWLYGSDEADGLFGATTGLVVTAGYLADDQNNTETRNYFVGGNVEPNSWHRLTIKSLANISSTNPDDTAPAGFVVFIDGAPVSSSEAKGVAGSAVDSLTPTANYWATANQLFPSVVKGNATNARTLTAVDIEGTGMIDDIYFTSEAPSFAGDNAYLTLNWDENVATLAYSVDGAESVNVEMSSAERNVVIDLGKAIKPYVVTISATYKNGYGAGEWTSDPAEALNGQEVSVSGTAVTVNITSYRAVCKIGDTEYGSLTEAMASILGGQSGTIVLLADVLETAYGAVEESAEVVLDLAGHTLKGGDYIDIFNGGAIGSVIDVYGTLTIIDSSVGKTGKIESVDVANYSAVWCFEGSTLNIQAGTYVGDIGLQKEGGTLAKVSISGGSFTSNDGENFYLADYVAQDYKAAYAGGYWTVSSSSTPDPTTYELTIPKVPGATALVTKKSDSSVVGNLTAIEAGTTVMVTWTATEGYKITSDATEEITMDANKTAATPTVKAIQYATVMITPVDNCTITVKNGETVVATGAKFDIDDQVDLTVTRKPDAGYELDNCAAEEVLRLDEEITYEITAAVKPVYPDYIPEDATADTKLKFDEWVTNKAGGDRDTASANMEAFLLNVAPDADLAAEKANFKVESITVVKANDGTVTVTVTTTTKNKSGEGYNGTVKVKGKVNLTDAEWLPKDNTQHRFFKAFLEVE